MLISSIKHCPSTGLSAAMYEEIEETDAAPGPAAKRPRAKMRAFTHIVSPGATVYPYKLSLKSEDIEFKSNRPFVGIQGTASSGFHLCEIRLDEKSLVQVSRSLTLKP